MNTTSRFPAAPAALLFGGTLAIAAAAEAGITVTSAYVNLCAGGAYASSFDVSVAATGLSVAGPASSLSLSAFGTGGFRVDAVSDGNDVWSVFGATFGLSVDSATTVRLTGNIDSSSASVFLVDSASNSLVYLRGPEAGAWDSGEIVLAAGGSYLIGINGPLTYANGGTETGVVLDFAVVPAPGAMGLLGLAGIAASRRRRRA